MSCVFAFFTLTATLQTIIGVASWMHAALGRKSVTLFILSIGCPLMSHWMLGFGFPLARHTKRPFSSGASTRLVGLSSQ